VPEIFFYFLFHLYIMNTFSSSHVIEDDVGRYGPDERSRMRAFGIRVELPVRNPVENALQHIRQLSTSITEMDAMQQPQIVDRMVQQRSALVSVLPEIGY